MEDKYIDWEKDENGLEIDKWTVPTAQDLDRWQKCFDKINELEARVKQLENS